MKLPMPKATPSELATLLKMVVMSVLIHLENRETGEVRKIVDGANGLFVVIPGWTDIYNQVQTIITKIDKERKQEIEEREVQRLKDLIVVAMGAVKPKEPTEEQPKAQPVPAKPTVLPPELSTEKAMKLWQLLQEAGYIDDNYQPRVSRPQAALIANKFFTVLDMEVQWSLFQDIWHRKNMRNDLSKARNSKTKNDTFIAKLNDLVNSNSEALDYVHPGAQRVHLT